VQRPAALRVKHAADRVGAVAALAVLSPLIGVIAWRIRSEDGGPVFFRQARAGADGKPFEVWKFRSMVVGADRVGLGLNVAAGDDRITRTGKLLRDWSLDELPQLINVALGEMSLVGPRPGLPDQAARDVLPLAGLQIDDDAALVAVEQQKEIAVGRIVRRRPQPPRPVAVRGPLDLDHIGAEPGQHLGAGRPRLVVGEVDDANAFERLAHLSLS